MRTPVLLSCSVVAALLSAACSSDPAPPAGAGSESAPTRSSDAPRRKAWQSLDVRFVEPASFEPGKPFVLELRVQGRPLGRAKARLFGTEGVEIDSFREPVVVLLDESGAATLQASVVAPKARGCVVVAHLEDDRGRLQEATCSLGGPPERPDRSVRLDDGTRVRLSPSD